MSMTARSAPAAAVHEAVTWTASALTGSAHLAGAPRAMSDGAATALIAGASAGGSFAVVLAAMIISLRRSQQRPRRPRRRRARRRTEVFDGDSRIAGSGSGPFPDPFPQQPYSPAEPASHRPYSRPYKVARREPPHGATNGSRPTGSDSPDGPLVPWAPPDEG
jgi:hypothetical protein